MTNPTPKIDRVNVYRDGSTWCYAAWRGDEYDHSDTLDADTESAARAEASAMFADAVVRRVADMPEESTR